MFVRKNNIRCYTRLLAVAEERRCEGLDDISSFVFNRPEKVIRELIDKAWDMAEASSTLTSKRKDRLEVLTTESACVCAGDWLLCANEVLQLNRTNKKNLQEQLRMRI